MSRRVTRSLTAAAAVAALSAGVVGCSTGDPVVEATTPPALAAPETAAPPQPAPTQPTQPAPTQPAPDPTSSEPTMDGPTPVDPDTGTIHKVPGKVVPNKDGRKAAPDGTKWTSLKLVGDEVPDEGWPDAQKLFSKKELDAIFPDAKSMKYMNCNESNYLGTDGNQTAHQTECELVIVMPGDSPNVPSHLNIRMRGFGPKQELLERWDRSMEIYKKLDSSRYTFYEDGSFGAARVMTNGITTRVLLANDKIAGEFSFGVIGFFHLTGEQFDYDESKKIFGEQIMPLLIQTLAAHMP